MLIQYAYIKPRSQFGKQCFFGRTDSIVQENILPDSKLMRDYVHVSHCHRGVQMSKQLALHEMQTVSKVTKENGMLHLEGGWPKEINVKDDEAVLRFRRRVMRDEYWAPKMKNLTNPMERCILQNNIINIYEHYFDDMESTAQVLSRDMRTLNMYADPQPIVRPINHLSWSPSAQNRLAAAYSFMEFERKLSNVNPSSYIWDIENPIKPVICLRSSSPLLIVEFNSHDSSMLISGLMSGQVCNWDIRIGDRPVQMSHRQFSHRNPANQTLWIQSKSNNEFFSASTDGAIKWWDIRKMRQPTEELVIDLDDPLRADILRAIGVTKLQPNIGDRFLAGMENGMVINIRRKAMNPVDKLAMRFNCHVGPVIAIDRNPFFTKNFLTVGDWTVKIWSEDIREGYLITIREQNADLRGGCWSRSRYSVFFTINATGLLEVYDILSGVASPVTTFRVCNDSLTTITPHENGQLLAVGSHDGNIYLVECSDGHIINTNTDKANLTAYFERCSRFKKIVDAQLKEIRLMQPSIHEDSAMDRSVFISMKKGNNREKSKNKMLVKEKGDLPKKKSRMKRLEKDDTFFEELVDSEAAFFQTVKKEFASYPKLDPETEQMISLMQETLRKKKIMRDSAKVEEKINKNAQKLVKNKERKRALKDKSAISLTRSLIKKIKVDKEKDEAVAKIEAPFIKPKGIVKDRQRQILSKVCAVEVCKPEICCADLEEKRKTELQTQVASEEEKYSWIIAQRRRKLFDFQEKLPEHSSIEKRRILLEEDEPLANVLADKVEEARREMRAWQKRIALSKRDSWRPRTIEVIHEKPEGKKMEVGNGDVESPVRNVKEERTDFRQLAETSSKWKSAIGDKTLQVRGKREAMKLDSHLEKCAQGEETHPTLFTCTDESTEMITTKLTKRSRGSDQ
ncbi:PREDICTED: dynein intermediate chain 3, ciliary-like [Trachymyrmex septentrionalis]|uniref:dynein intermediate chain 3, ciliary-like n=1 Tax=Trachymyrmex septentrionalis TaxID=34720 RepID=UPI00084F0B7A|nr:PREDICTED: dynein intermediate chain 3, ciliary-like [Trachymyrmex septentrionalis]